MLIPDCHGITCFHIACGRGHYEVARLLIDHVKNAAPEGEIANQVRQVVENADAFGWRPLHHAAAQGRLDVCILLADVTEGSLEILPRAADGCTPLHVACLNAQSDVQSYVLIRKFSSPAFFPFFKI